MEEPRVIRRSLLAAALQQSPRRRVVLLIDDPPVPRDAEAAARLAAARDLPREITALLEPPRQNCERALEDFLARRLAGPEEPAGEAMRLATLWRDAADWIDALADATDAQDHNEALLVDRVLRAAARSHRQRAALWSAGPVSTPDDRLAEYRRLTSLFQVEMTSFERKRYVNLSHEPNKAMNLNAYLGLMGGRFRQRLSPEGRLLEPAAYADATLHVPDADFVIVLDADSVILPEYSLRLVHFMGRPDNERVAVVQTPYTSVPGAPGVIERIAGATTDLQLMSHQGATRFGAGSWVGASALIRRAALEDIRCTRDERGHTTTVFIRDRTLNEDTDTTVALIRHGWRVHNYPDRLAYSATPPDFGALLIQRRRWATGGLIILPDLLRYALARPTPTRLGEALIRAQYILAAPVGSLGVAALMFLPFSPLSIWSPWVLPVVAVYLAVYVRDLGHNGGRRADLPRVLAFQTMLLPINLAGAMNSTGQLLTGRRIPFERTPKVEGRTAASPAHVIAQCSILLYAVWRLLLPPPGNGPVHAAFFGITAAAAFYALSVYIGWREAMEDLAGGAMLRPRAWLDRRARRRGAEGGA